MIDEVLTLFKIVKAKDIFEEFYQRGLCRRLLLKKSASYDSEKKMIMKLKTECSDGFISKVEGMMKDLTVSNELMKKYQLAFGDQNFRKFGGVEAFFSVLSSNCWPINTEIVHTMPREVSSL
mmetsp:Transcript_6153/g.9898  ORF Transcript_6153/g.9898 Transcript_6153/m.9898 type:complete len:122 (-) Transcript_6153:950-1315(-)